VGNGADKGDRELNEVYYGIHVFASESVISWWMTASYHNNRVTVPVVCKKDDFIAHGVEDDMVYTKVELLEKDYYEALQKVGAMV
jgi:hypothetical protein